MAVIESITLAIGLMKTAGAFLDWIDGDEDARAATRLLRDAEDSLANYLQVHPDPVGTAVLNALRASIEEVRGDPSLSDHVRRGITVAYRRFRDFATPRAFWEGSAAVAAEARAGAGLRLTKGGGAAIVGMLALVLLLPGCGRLTRERIDRAAQPPMLTVQFPEGVTTATLSIHERAGRVWVASPISE